MQVTASSANFATSQIGPLFTISMRTKQVSNKFIGIGGNYISQVIAA